jgi:hypothetical protein
MKSKLKLLALLPFVINVATAEVEVTMKELQAIGFLPQDKEALQAEAKVDPKKINPFAVRTKKVTESAQTDNTESEESKIRNFFESKKVSGAIMMDGKRTVCIGRLLLEEGKAIPSVIPGQTHLLRVTKITDKLVELAWVEGLGVEGQIPRKIQRPIDLAPRVMQVLASEEEPSGETKLYAVDPTGRIIQPKASLAPNPSELVDNLPQSELENATALQEDEQAILKAQEGSETAAPNSASQASAISDVASLVRDTLSEIMPSTSATEQDAAAPAAVEVDPDAASAPPADAPVE